MNDYRPALLEQFGIGADTAAEILIVVGDNAERIKSEAAFAKLAGISPIPTGSGQTSGRQRTKVYVARRTAEGESKRVIIRCLKRYVIREVYHLIKAQPATAIALQKGS